MKNFTAVVEAVKAAFQPHQPILVLVTRPIPQAREDGTTKVSPMDTAPGGVSFFPDAGANMASGSSGCRAREEELHLPNQPSGTVRCTEDGNAHPGHGVDCCRLDGFSGLTLSFLSLPATLHYRYGCPHMHRRCSTTIT